MSDFEVVSVNLSRDKGTPKQPASQIAIDRMGVVHDAHAGNWHRQVSVLGQEIIDRFAAESGRTTRPGEFAENLTTRGLDLAALAVLDRLEIGPVELEVTQIGKSCHGPACAIFQEVGRCVMPTEGVFCRVVRGGVVRPGDRGRHLPHVLDLRVITLSDRAARGEYADRSGPRVEELLAAFFAGKRWHVGVRRSVLADDAPALRQELLRARDEGAAAVFTTGGTGLGPRDITPETAAAVCDRLIPGIMEHIRATFGAAVPNALLSRSIAGLAGTTQVYTLPGSLRAVEEYLGEILKTFEHLLYMIHGIDTHA